MEELICTKCGEKYFLNDYDDDFLKFAADIACDKCAKHAYDLLTAYLIYEWTNQNNLINRSKKHG